MWATISKQADRWFVSISVEMPENILQTSSKKARAVGVDLGITHLATLSTGEKIENPNALERILKRLKRLSKRVSRKKLGSKNRHKAKLRLSKLHMRIVNIRKDALHKLTTKLSREFDTVCLEDLNVAGMVKNKRLARRLSDSSFGEFKRQIEYKSEARGGKVIYVDRFYPSSKTCSNCGEIRKELALSTRRWTCSHCIVEHDRDINAAINILNQAASSAVSACGGRGSGSSSLRIRRVKQLPVKQEVSSNLCE